MESNAETVDIALQEMSTHSLEMRKKIHVVEFVNKQYNVVDKENVWECCFF